MKFVNPKNDVAFKKIFGDEQKKTILISFLNAVLNLTEEKEIQDIAILNPYQAPKIEALKYTLLDVRAKDRRGVTFIIEMQVERVTGLRKRFAYYAAKAYTAQIERGEDYPKLNQVIFIGILDFAEFESAQYLTRHIILNTETYRQELNDLEFNFIELPKFTKREEELETILDKWIYFIKHADELAVIPTNTDIEPLREAYAAANTFSWTREELDVYDYWGMKAQDERGMVHIAVEQIACNLLAKGIDLCVIAETTGLSMEEVTALTERKIQA